MTVTLILPGQATLADWRAIYAGGVPLASTRLTMPPWPQVPSGGQNLARGEPVYGINTGFGKLAGVRIAPPIWPLQRNIVLSHAAGVGEPPPSKLRGS